MAGEVIRDVVIRITTEYVGGDVTPPDMKPLVWFWCACLFLLSARVGAGQTYQGGIRGQVRDQQGVIPGVEVTLLNEAMNTGRTIVTNEVGEYAFANVNS